MEKCFTINGNELYLALNLVDLNNIPIYFVCKDNTGQYYICLCYDIDYEKYIIVKTDIDRIYKLLTQNITMRDIITLESEFIDISILGEEEIYSLKNMKDINFDILPDKNSYFIITNEHFLEEFLKEIKGMRKGGCLYGR